MHLEIASDVAPFSLSKEGEFRVCDFGAACAGHDEFVEAVEIVGGMVSFDYVACDNGVDRC